MSGWPPQISAVPTAIWRNSRFQTKPKAPVIPHDTAARVWGAKPCTDTNDLLGVLSFFICQGIPEEHLEAFVAAVVPKCGWTHSALRWAGLLRGRRMREEYNAIFTNLIWEYGRDQG